MASSRRYDINVSKKRLKQSLLHSKWLLWPRLPFVLPSGSLFVLFPISLTPQCFLFSLYWCHLPFSPPLLRCSRGAEGVPGLHPSPAYERHHPWPRRESQGHTWGQAWLPRSLYQLWDVLPQWRKVCGEVQRVLVWLHQHRLWWSILHQRWETYYNRKEISL